MAPSTALWNPSQVLQLGPYSPEASSTCIGHARSRNRRCRNQIAAANQQEASKLLDRIGSTDITRNVDLSEELEDIAARLLCQRWHQGDALLVARRWMQEVENFRTNAEGERRRAVTPTIEEEVTFVTTTTATTRSTSTTASGTTTTTSSTTTVQRVAGTAGTTASPQTSSVPRTTSVTPLEASSTQRTLPSSPRPTRSTSAAPTPPTRRQSPPPTAALPPAAPLLTPPQSPSLSSSDPQPPATPPPPAQECPICYDDVHEDEQRTLNCNHSFHTACIRTWFANQDGCSRPRTCPFCRHEEGNEWAFGPEGDETE